MNTTRNHLLNFVAAETRAGVVMTSTTAIRAWLLLAVSVPAGICVAAPRQPFVATYSTFVGAGTDAGYDSLKAIATDPAGNVYLAGVTRFDTRYPDERTFPTTPGSFRPPNPRSPDNPCQSRCGYVLKLDPDHRVVYGALIPTIYVEALAVDSSGAAYVTGGYNAVGGDPPVTPNAFSTQGYELVLKLKPDGSALEYGAAFFAGESRAIAVDGSGHAYVVGEVVGGPGLPTTAAALKPNYQDIPDLANTDAFILKIAPNGTTLVYGTYLGGTERDSGFGVAVDDAGRAMVVGRTESTDFVGFSGPNAGFNDAFAMLVAADGSAIIVGRYFGGSENDRADAVSRDEQGGYLIAGRTNSANFPVTAGVVQTVRLGDGDGWVARLGADLGVRYVTYFGGSQDDGVVAIASDADSRAYVVGPTTSGDLLTTPDGFQDLSSSYSAAPTGGAGRDFYPDAYDAAHEAFFAVLDPTGAQVEHGTYLAGYLSVPRGWPPLTTGLAVARTPGAVYVGGITQTPSFPSIAGGLADTIAGSDGFLTQLSPQDLVVGSPTVLPDARREASYDYQLEARGGAAPYRWEVVGFALPDGLSLTSSGRITGVPSLQQSETQGRQWTVRVTDALGRSAHKSLMINVRYDYEPVCTTNRCTLSMPAGQMFSVALPYPARGVGPFQLSLSGTLPPGSTVDYEKALVGGIPATAGDYSFDLALEDFLGTRRTLSWEVHVAGLAPPPPTPAPPAPAPPAPAPTSPAPSGGTSSGGGGALAPADIIGLLGALALLTTRRRPARPNPSDRCAVTAREAHSR